ncbi:hypothetical protein [Streptomyces sp. NPDC059134]|uniref:hypothetical protein n=1 Tax=Streptomyces sp. NPDC059134 TaxID=3346738 RepID=UPI0036B94319
MAMYLIVLLAALARKDYATAWFFASALCTISALLRRIGSCRVVLYDDFLLTENPIRTYSIPYTDIRDVEATSTGGLRIETRNKKEVHPFAFGGSMLDNLFKTSEKAASDIKNRKDARRPSPPKQEVSHTQHFRRCRSADSLLIISAISAVAGLVTKII